MCNQCQHRSLAYRVCHPFHKIHVDPHESARELLGSPILGTISERRDGSVEPRQVYACKRHNSVAWPHHKVAGFSPEMAPPLCEGVSGALPEPASDSRQRSPPLTRRRTESNGSDSSSSSSGSEMKHFRFVVRRQESLSRERPSMKQRSLSEDYKSMNVSSNGKWLSDTEVFETIQIQDLADEDVGKVYSKFLQAHRCYDLIPISSKLVVFDTTLHVKKAFFALVYNGVRAAPLWDHATQSFVGMLTITDFIKILHKYYKAPLEKIAEVEEHKIQTWRQEFKIGQNLTRISPEASLYDAVSILKQHKVHRLPVVDRQTGNVLHVLTHKRILRFLHHFVRELPEPAMMERGVGELGVGTYGELATTTYDMPLIDALALFLRHRVSALPVVDADRRVLDVYAKFDVINLAAEKTYSNLDVTIFEALQHRTGKQDKVHTCLATDSLRHVLETIVRAEVHRLVIVDTENRIEGILSLSDMFNHMVLKPVENDVKSGK
ncbi:PREDICTED: 5'-AMP-activated protein kinase subunit gamma-1-like isoform X2 [Priapulus caudatus]|uniref:5'-AMP-activated protein kinase subunit gamma-1-like isoform X2 n=1 Tax=Priapulus caudatus TaxID=37621 RepID=A0ABM1EML1_PRICU|nr:PREDICTED: 5'-AMP-activated protein kinase subunit gamma-1-like isoform X2 [Priapulus caudatus]